MGIPSGTRAKLRANVYCGHCRGAVSIVNMIAMIKRMDLLVQGNCATCGHEVARLVEGAGHMTTPWPSPHHIAVLRTGGSVKPLHFILPRQSSI